MAGKKPDLFARMFGADMQKRLMERTIQQLRASWCEQGREERSWRLSYIEKMIFEKKRIVDTYGIQATAWCDAAIEAIIMGDADGIRTSLLMFDFEGEHDEYRIDMTNRFARFKEICQEARDTMQASGQRGMQA